MKTRFYLRQRRTAALTATLTLYAAGGSPSRLLKPRQEKRARSVGQKSESEIRRAFKHPRARNEAYPHHKIRPTTDGVSE